MQLSKSTRPIPTLVSDTYGFGRLSRAWWQQKRGVVMCNVLCDAKYTSGIKMRRVKIKISREAREQPGANDRTVKVNESNQMSREPKNAKR